MHINSAFLATSAVVLKTISALNLSAASGTADRIKYQQILKRIDRLTVEFLAGLITLKHCICCCSFFMLLFVLLYQYVASYFYCSVDMLHPICTPVSICCIPFVPLCRYAASHLYCCVDMLHYICTALSYAASHSYRSVDMLHPIYAVILLRCFLTLVLCTTQPSVTWRRLVWVLMGVCTDT